MLDHFWRNPAQFGVLTIDVCYRSKFLLRDEASNSDRFAFAESKVVQLVLNHPMRPILNVLLTMINAD